MSEEEEKAQVESEEEPETEEQAAGSFEVRDDSGKVPPPVSPPKQLTDELKVVIVMKASNILLGVQNPDCDPVYTTMKGTLDEALEKVPGLVAEAKQKWEASPRYPKADLPEPAPRAVSTGAGATTPKAQPSMF